MIFNRHFEYAEDDHAFLSPSQPYWLRYDIPKLEESFSNWKAAQMGTRKHAFAKEAILLGQKLPNTRQTLNMFVNDAIGFRMTPEVRLVYTENCHGTADAISFNRNLLRIHDLKTGKSPGKMEQLEVYAALFCMEYEYNPSDIDIELRIYQNDEAIVHIPETIDDIIAEIIHKDQYVSSMRQLL